MSKLTNHFVQGSIISILWFAFCYGLNNNIQWSLVFGSSMGLCYIIGAFIAMYGN